MGQNTCPGGCSLAQLQMKGELATYDAEGSRSPAHHAHPPRTPFVKGLGCEATEWSWLPQRNRTGWQVCGLVDSCWAGVQVFVSKKKGAHSFRKGIRGNVMECCFFAYEFGLWYGVVDGSTGKLYRIPG